jgi:hypothetical protein
VNEKTLDTNALLKTIGGGLVIALLFIAFGHGVNALLLGIAPGEIPDRAMLPTGYWIYTICLSCVGYLFYALIGSGYGFFAQRNGMAPHVGRMALGGAIALAAIGIVAGTINLLTTPVMRISREIFMSAGLPSYGFFRGFFLLSVSIGLCIALMIYVVLGAGGGAIYGLIARGREKRASTAGPLTVE